MHSRKLLTACMLIAALLALAGCANVTKVGPGDVVVADRVALRLDGAWNQMPDQRLGAATWTQDGGMLDLLRLFVGVKDGGLLVPTLDKNQRPLTFKATMEPHEVAALFQGFYTRDGSSFQLERLEPADFMGGKGFRFRFASVRKIDDVKITGVVWAVVRNKELLAITYTAPSVGFYARHLPRVEQVVTSARIRS